MDNVIFTKKPEPQTPQSNAAWACQQRYTAHRSRRMGRCDWVIMISITLLYAILAYTNLGASTFPQTSFTFKEASEQVVFDLGEHQDNFHMLFMSGLCDSMNALTVQVSDDGETWREGIPCGITIINIFQWCYVNTDALPDPRALSGRYVRLTAEREGLVLLETLFRDAQSRVLQVSVAGERDAAALIDEPSILQGEPSWYNGMYFDEICHARTGYEYLHGIKPYEKTHPPLGKVFISWGIALFGMNPFGWRFAGATCGVLMLPGMYLLGKLLFGKRRYAVLPCLLLALDTLHFTQTRVATIDSFVVLFIIWSVYCMLRWFYADFFGQKLWRTMIPLALSGLFMGLAVASKWQGCFAGIGLAVIFFYGIGRRWREIKAARSLPEHEDDGNTCLAAEKGRQRLLVTIVSCLVFFVAVPLVIYWCAYIPHFASEGGVTAQRIVDAASYMLSYHNIPMLNMENYYASPWYEWPLSLRPMFYFSPALPISAGAVYYGPDGYTSVIHAFGNYAVWWGGLLALLLTCGVWCRQILDAMCRFLRARRSTPVLSGNKDPRPRLLIICFAAQYVPWAFVARGTFIYHYFPSIPFIILCIPYVLERWENWYIRRTVVKAPQGSNTEAFRRSADRRVLSVVICYLVIVAAMFAAFFPPASGVLVRGEWMEQIDWFGNLYYYTGGGHVQ